MKIKYTIMGIDCPACAEKLAGNMSKIEGVETAKINFLTEKLTVETSLSEDEAYKLLLDTARAFSRDIIIEK